MDFVKEDGSLGVCYCKSCREQVEALKKTLATRIEKHQAKKAAKEAFFKAEKERLEFHGMDLEDEAERLQNRTCVVDCNERSWKMYFEKFQEHIAVPGNPTKNIPPHEFCPGKPIRKRKLQVDASSD